MEKERESFSIWRAAPIFQGFSWAIPHANSPSGFERISGNAIICFHTLSMAACVTISDFTSRIGKIVNLDSIDARRGNKKMQPNMPVRRS